MSAFTRGSTPGRMALLMVALAALVLLAAVPGRSAQAQATDSKTAQDEEFLSIRQDERIFQLEEIAALISRSLGKISDRVTTLAINSLYFGTAVDRDFRRKAEVVILAELLNKNPTVKLVQCQECQKLETKIVRGVLKLRKGIPSQEARIELAKKLGADGFIDIGIFQDGGQLTMYIKVVEAETGAIILVDELAGRRAPRRDSLTFSFGELNFPISSSGLTVTHNALAIGVSESVQLTGRFSFAVDLSAYVDNNTTNPDPHLILDTGLLLAPTLAFDVVQIPSSTSRLLLYVGLGKLLSPQLNYGNLFRAGLEFVVGDRLVVVLGVVNFVETNIATGVVGSAAQLKGTGNEIRFGYRF